jgi:hypothetical protein
VPPQRPRNQARSGPVRPRPVAFSNVRATTERPNPGRQPRPVRPAEPDPAATELPLEDHDPVPQSEDLGVLCRDHSSEQPPAVPACWPHRDRPVTALRLNRPAPPAAPALLAASAPFGPTTSFRSTMAPRPAASSFWPLFQSSRMAPTKPSQTASTVPPGSWVRLISCGPPGMTHCGRR